MSRTALATAAASLAIFASACGPSTPKAPVGPPPEYEDARPPVPASATSATPSATPASPGTTPP